MKIIYENADGGVSIVTPAPDVPDLNALARSVVPSGTAYQIIDDHEVPTDRTFRDAWVHNKAGWVGVDLDKAKCVGHDIRRAKRSEEFKPHDELMAARIPGTDEVAVEAARQEIRDRYELIQAGIDAAEDTDSIKSALEGPIVEEEVVEEIVEPAEDTETPELS